ncbi:MAG: hypothetical protein JWM36_3032 [Hyphomicrobiales bacterium]|nr:hypothetical protein [Hyphomicrobiales bacterium]
MAISPSSFDQSGMMGDEMRPGQAMSAALAETWWTLALRGLIAIAFGVMAFVSPGAVMLSVALLFGAYLLIDGAIGIVAAIRAARADKRWWLLLIEALLNVAMGLIALTFPAGAILAFVVVTAVWALMSGGFLLAAAFSLTMAHGRLWLAIGGLVSIVWGLLLIATPLMGAVVLTWWLGAYALVFGIMLVAVGFKLRAQRQSLPPTAAMSTGR